MNSFNIDKMHMLLNQNKSCVKPCKNIALNKTLFSNMCTFYPIVLKRQIITDLAANLCLAYNLLFEVGF